MALTLAFVLGMSFVAAHAQNSNIQDDLQVPITGKYEGIVKDTFKTTGNIKAGSLRQQNSDGTYTWMLKDQVDGEDILIFVKALPRRDNIDPADWSVIIEGKTFENWTDRVGSIDVDVKGWDVTVKSKDPGATLLEFTAQRAQAE